MKFAVVRKGKAAPVRLNDKQRTLLVFDSEIKAHKICKRMNVESQQQRLRCIAYEVRVC